MSSPWRVRNSSGSDGSGQSSTSRRPPGRSDCPGRAQDARCVVELVERVLEVGEVVLAAAARPGHARLRGSSIRSASPAAATFARARTTESGLELDADQLERREPPGHRDQPPTAAAVDVDDAPAARQVGDQLRQRRERLLEEDRDVLGGQPLDGDAVAIRSRPGSAGRSGRSRPSRPSRARRPWRGRTGRRGTRAGLRRGGRRRRPRRSSGGRLERHQVVRVGRPRPGLDRLAAGSRPRPRARRRRQAGRRPRRAPAAKSPSSMPR